MKNYFITKKANELQAWLNSFGDYRFEWNINYNRNSIHFDARRNGNFFLSINFFAFTNSFGLILTHDNAEMSVFLQHVSKEKLAEEMARISLNYEF